MTNCTGSLQDNHDKFHKIHPVRFRFFIRIHHLSRSISESVHGIHLGDTTVVKKTFYMFLKKTHFSGSFGHKALIKRYNVVTSFCRLIRVKISFIENGQQSMVLQGAKTRAVRKGILRRLRYHCTFFASFLIS